MSLNQKILRLCLVISTLLAGVMVIAAQDAEPTATPTVGNQAGSGTRRFDMLRDLGLSREQVQSIRRLNAERKPLIEAAQLKFRDSLKALDEAIYADDIDEQIFQARLKDVQLAQAELHRVRFAKELGIRRILTPLQLSQFRELRQRFAAEREAATANDLNNRPVRKALRQKRDRNDQPPRIQNFKQR